MRFHARVAVATSVLVALFGASPAAADTVLVFGERTAERNNLAATLAGLGHTVTNVASLPVPVSGFDTVWHVGALAALTAAEQEALVEVLAAGGGVHLTGERPCCEALNDSLQAIVREAVSGAGSVVVGDQGDIDPPYRFLAGATGGVATTPNVLTAWAPLAPGGMAGLGGLPNPNVLAVGPGDVPVGAAWKCTDLVERAGKLTILMDVDWLGAIDAYKTGILQNLQRFLTTPCLADLEVAKDDGVGSAVPGATVTYTIRVSNLGPHRANGARVTDAFAAPLGSCTWTCAGSGASCPANGAGAIDHLIDVAPGGTATYTANCRIAANATGSVANTANVAAPSGIEDPNPADNSATDTDALTPTASLSITKTNGQTTSAPGGPVTYTIVASNAGPSDAPGATVADAFPTVLSGVAWTCAGVGGGTCPGSGSGGIATAVNLPAGSSVTFSATGTIASTATGSLSNTATVAAPAGVADPSSGDNSATDTDTLVPTADLRVTKTDGQTEAIAGSAVTYTIAVSNAGPSAVTGASVTDTFPATLSGVSWTCSPAAGGTCTASGSGAIADTVNLPVGASATYTATGTLSASASGSLANTATVAPPSGTTDPVPGNNSASDTDAIIRQADLTITKTDGVTSAVPGQSLAYTIVVANSAGPSAATGATVSDTFPAALSCVWTCTAAGGGTCTPGQVAGNLSDTVNLPVGASLTYLAACTIAPAATGTLANTATVSPAAGTVDPVTNNNTARDIDTRLTPKADLAVAKTASLSSVAPGGSLTFNVVAANASGPSSANGVRVTDDVPVGLDCSWTCTGSGGASCTAPPAGADDLDDLAAALPVGGSVRYTGACTVALDASGTLVNTATVTAPTTVTDPSSANDSASISIQVLPRADLSLTKTADRASAAPGESLTYTLTVTNAGPAAVTGAQVTDTFPAAFTGVIWTCLAPPGASCTASGSGNLVDLANLAAGTSVVYTVTGTISSAATGTLANTAAVAPPSGVFDPSAANNSSGVSTSLAPRADLAVTKTDGVTSAVPGQSVSYTITVANAAGPSNVSGALVSDVFPVGLTCHWGCTGAGGAVCNPGQVNGSVLDTATLPVGAVATYTAVCAISPSAAGTLENTVSVSGATFTDPVVSNNTAADRDTVLAAQADVSITVTDGSTTAVPGSTVTYAIAVANASGPSAAASVRVVDDFPPQLAGCSWSCAPGAGAGCAPLAGTGDVDAFVSLGVGATANLSATCTIAPAATGTLTNTATATLESGTDPVAANDSATDTSTLLPTADLTISVADAPDPAQPGGTLTYSILAANPVPLFALTAGEDSDALWKLSPLGAAPVRLGSVEFADCRRLRFEHGWPVATCGFGETAKRVRLDPWTGVGEPLGPDTSAAEPETPPTAIHPLSGLPFTVADRPDGSVLLAGEGVVGPAPAGVAGLAFPPAGASDVAGAIVADSFPDEVTCSTTCSAAGGAQCTAVPVAGDLADLVTLPVGGAATYSASCTIASAATGTLLDVATVTLPAGTADPDLNDNGAFAETALALSADLAIAKTDGAATATPGGTVTYTVTASNSAGPSGIAGATVTDLFPAALSACSWSCVASGGASCTAGPVAGDLVDAVGLPVGGRAVYTATCTVDEAATGTLVNTATVSAPAGVDTNAANDSATDIDTLVGSADLSLALADSPDPVYAGALLDYQVTVANAGPSTSSRSTVSLLLPIGATVVAGAVPGAPNLIFADGFESGDLSAWQGAPRPPCTFQGRQVFCTFGSIVEGGSLSLPLRIRTPAGVTGSISTSGTVAGVESDPQPASNATSATTAISPARVDLSVALDDTPDPVAIGQILNYTALVSNAGPAAATSVVLDDPLPVGVAATAVTVTPPGQGTCSVDSFVHCALGTLAVGSSVRVDVETTVQAGAPPALTNEVSVDAAEPELAPGDNLDFENTTVAGALTGDSGTASAPGGDP